MFDPRETGTSAFHGVARISDDPVITTDLNGTITSFNEAAERLYGYRSDEVVGRPVAVLSCTGGDIEEQEILAAAKTGVDIRRREAVRRHRDGTPIPVALSVARIETGATVTGTIQITRDLRKHEGSDRPAWWLAAIVESSDDAIASKDLNGIVTSWNRAAEKMFGYSADEMIGRSIRTIIPAERQAEEDAVLASLRRGEKVDHFETVRQHKNGTLIPISLTVSPIYDGERRIVGASKIARDISERKRVDAERARLHAEIERANQLKDDFLATLSHELRTPLNAILGYARMMRNRIVPPDRYDKAIETIERNAASLTQIVEDVLEISRITSGKLRLHPEHIDIVGVVRNAIEAVRPAADAKRVDLLVLDESEDLRVYGDAERLQQVMWNLLSNAVKFTGRGGRIDVTFARTDASVEVVVSDTGIGIAPEFLPHIFERFRQADASTTRERGGLGLGLAIARQLVEMHGGTITADSEGPGKGATFRVRLPESVTFQRDRGERRPAVGEQPATNAPDMPRLNGVRVVVVDDDPDALRMSREILEAAGAEVVVATSALAALTVVQTSVPDVLVADLGMPRVDGFELIRRIRRSTNEALRNLPAAALTAYVRSEDRRKALDAGFQVHLAKPIDPAELMNAVASLARRTQTTSG